MAEAVSWLQLTVLAIIAIGIWRIADALDRKGP